MNISKSIIALTGVSILVTLWVLTIEVSCNCFCPRYPIIGLPACYAVIVFFGAVMASQFNKRYSQQLFYFGSIFGLVTAIWFSINQLTGMAECPRLFGIPLCYVALGTFFLLIFLQSAQNGIKMREKP